MNVHYTGRNLRDYLISIQEKTNSELVEEALFLRNLQTYFNSYIGAPNPCAMWIQNPVHSFNDSFPIRFEMMLEVAYPRGIKKFYLDCVAKKAMPDEYVILINDKEYIFNISGEVAGVNPKTFSELVQQFSLLFEPTGEIAIDLLKTE